MNRDERIAAQLAKSEEVFACIQRARLAAPHPWVWDWLTDRNVAMGVIEQHRPAEPGKIVDLAAWKEAHRRHTSG